MPRNSAEARRLETETEVNAALPAMEPAEAPAPHCRFCSAPLTVTFADLGAMPSANAYRRSPDAPEVIAPLHARVCGECFLVQVEAFHTPAELFGDYAYFSSCSSSWLHHAALFAEQAVARFNLGSASRVVEIASNDGYLLQYFKQKGVEVLGIEPAANVAAAAMTRGVPTQVRFFGTETARQLREDGLRADLLIGNNVLAHVPDINDFVAGLPIGLKQDGVVSMEFPHLLRLIEQSQFDTIYHEHFSYLSFRTVQRIFGAHGLVIFEVEELPTHGGSLRIYARRSSILAPIHHSVGEMRRRERDAGLEDLDTYRSFAAKVAAVQEGLMAFLLRAKAEGKRVAAYGAAAKGNTLLNSCGVTPELIDYVVDISPHKQGLFLPGSGIPVVAPAHVAETRPDYLLILPWNLTGEITGQMAEIRDWGGQFVVAVPELRVLP